MPVLSGSRYATGRQVKIEATRNGRTQPIPFIYTRKKVPSDVEIAFTYRIQRGERLDQLAYRFAGDSRLWWIIADVNNIIRFPFFLSAGTELLIPTKNVFRTYGG